MWLLSQIAHRAYIDVQVEEQNMTTEDSLTYATAKAFVRMYRRLFVDDMTAEAFATEYMTFTRLADDLPVIDLIRNGEEGYRPPKDVRQQCLLVEFLTVLTLTATDFRNAWSVIQFMPVEFQVMYMRQVLQDRPELAYCLTLTDKP